MSGPFLLICMAATTVIAAGAQSVNVSARETLDYRLPTTVWPYQYVIEVTPHFISAHGKEQFTFDGKVDIWLSATVRDMREITLHASRLNVSSNVRLRDATTPLSEIKVVSQEYDSRTQMSTIRLASAMIPGRRYVLTIQYVGELGTDLKGFYRSSYEENGEIKWLVTTQMQPTYARQVFPCFDEPQFKAYFIVKINRPSTYQPSISNARIELTELDAGPGIVRETFARTPLMSTYLLGFIVSEFSVRENVQKTFSVYSRPSVYSQTEYSFNVGQQVLDKYDEVLDLKYYTVPEVTKLSMAAVPDFDVGGMENWGLVIYREVALLFDASEASAYTEQRVVLVIAHELAHMWFGDLVTCEWWSYTWLNEGFARYLQFFMTALLHKDWDLDLQFVTEQLQAIMRTDALESAHPLTKPAEDVNTVDDIQELFSAITYSKGAAVIRMTEHVMGRDKFLAGLQQYLKENSLKTTTPGKLFSALQRELIGEDIDIAAFLGSFTVQPGYPVITIEVQRNRRDIRISQRRFLLQNKDHQDASKWEVPLSFATPFENVDFEKTKNQFLLSSQTNVLEVNLQHEIDWIVFNVQQTGYYRVNYDNITWTNIGRVLRASPQRIHVLNRAQIVDDALNLARGGLMNFILAFETIEFLVNETHYSPWVAAFNNFAYIGDRFKPHEIEVFKAYNLRLLAKVYDHLKFSEQKNDSRLDIYNRVNVLSNLCRNGHPKCIADAQHEFTQMTTVTYSVPVNLRPVVYCTAIRESSDSTEWDHLWSAFKLTNIAAEQKVILDALGCSHNPDIIRKYLKLILSNEIRLQDKKQAFLATFSNAINADVVLDFIVENHRKISKSFQSETMIGPILEQLAARFTTAEQVRKLQSFVDTNKDDYGEYKSIARGIKNAEYNVKWADEYMPHVIAYMRKSNGSGGNGVRPQASLLAIALLAISYIFYV